MKGKIIQYFNVFGKPVKQIQTGEGGVNKVDTLPEQGEEGKIYYNTTTGTYYISDNGKWRTFNETTVVTSLDDVEYDQGIANSYILKPGTFYDIEDWRPAQIDDPINNRIAFVFDPSNGMYAGRFTAFSDRANITWPTGVTIPESVDTTITNGHTYEFNVWRGVLFMVDVTPSEEGGE